MATQVQIRRGTTAQHASFTGAAGELTVDTDKKAVVVHDGSTAGGIVMLRADQSNLPTSAPTTGLYTSSGSAVISTGGTGRLFVGPTGQIGISQSSLATGGFTAGTLRIGHSTGQTAGVLLQNTSTATDSSFWYTDGTGSYLGSNNGFFAHFAGGNERLRITSTGTVNIVGAGSAGSTQAISFNGSAPVNSLVVDSSGRLGVGTSSPSYPFHLVGTGSYQARIEASTGTNSASLHFANTSGNIFVGIDSNDGSAINSNTAYARVIWSQGAYPLVFATNNTRAMTIDSSQRVGIGTPSPGAPLDVVGVGRFTGGGGYVSFGDNGYIRTDAANELRLQGGTSGTTFWKAGLASESARIDNSGRLLVGTSSALLVGEAQHLFQVESVSATPHGGSFVRHGGTSAGAGAVITLGRSRGTSAGAVTAVADGDTLGYLLFTGSNGSDFSNTAAWIQCQVDGVPFSSGDTTDLPGRLVFSTTKDGTSSPVERFKISSDGSFRFLTPDSVSVGAMKNSRNANGDQVLILQNGANANNTSSYYLVCQEEAVANRCFIYGNGNIANTNNSYGAISDLKLKENIVLASSQWNDIKALQVRKYNFKAGTGQPTHTQIGLIAQEVEEVSPGLVYESPDLDAENNDLGTVTKSVNYSVLYMKAVKALQEAMERIEQLEAKVAALESA